MSQRCRCTYGMLLGILLILGAVGTSYSERATGFQPLGPVGPQTLVDALEPSLRKWYVPQELYQLYKWEQWAYTNYAREHYRRYTDITLEGFRFYDLYGNFITRGWKIYEWSLDQPRAFGNSIFKNPKYSKWFDSLIISSASKGQYYTALTIGDAIRTTLTPLTFSKPTFNGLQWDFTSDKYAFTALASRADNPGTHRNTDLSPPENQTDYVNFLGFRGTVQLGDFVNVGGTYVNAHLGRSIDDWVANSLKGRLSTGQNAGKVRTITVLISDDSPEDGVGGGVLFAEQIFIDGIEADIAPVIKGGVVQKGRREASGNQEILLIYDISEYTYVNAKGELKDVNAFRKASFQLILANDYKVEITSNLQTDVNGQEIVLPVARAPGNVKDGTNQRLVRFDYGLPTGNEIYGITLELDDVWGVSLRAEYNRNRRHRRFPNINVDVTDHSLTTNESEAWYLTAVKETYPWFMYGEAFSMDSEYATWMFISDASGRIYYDDRKRYVFEFVDDNDDQDRYPDWQRDPANQREGNDESRKDGVFPGLDENNDLVPDFNQNQNTQPDYEEPFLRYSVDPPEYLFGMDMNHNTVIDRFENDDEADYPYKRGHRGYNVYAGGELARGFKAMVGRLHEWLPGSDRRSRSNYALFTYKRDFPRVGTLRVFEHIRGVHDDIPDDLIQWVQLPKTIGGMQRFDDPLVARNTTINTVYADFHYVGIPRSNFFHKIKLETYRQRQDQEGMRSDARFLGLIDKFDYTLDVGGFAIQPKIKSMFMHSVPFKRTESRRKELSEILFLTVGHPMLNTVRVDGGLEYTLFFNLMDKPAGGIGEYVDDFQGLALAIQFSNVSSFMGYELTAKMGFRQQTWYFEDETKTGSIGFVSVFAGMQD